MSSTERRTSCGVHEHNQTTTEARSSTRYSHVPRSLCVWNRAQRVTEEHRDDTDVNDTDVNDTDVNDTDVNDTDVNDTDVNDTDVNDS